jgi:hypothetical protein
VESTAIEHVINPEYQSADEAGRIFSSMRDTAIESGPSIEHPLAHSCPPPPKSSAISATLSLPLLRKLTR